MKTNAKGNTIVTPTAEQVAYAAEVISKLEAMSNERFDWEEGEYKTANQRLYKILADCQKVYVEEFLNVKDEDRRRHLRKEIEECLKKQGVKTQSRSETLTLFVRMVFKSDRQRTYSYVVAIKAAIAANVHYTALPEYIESQGGIEDIRIKTPLSEKTKANHQKREEANKLISQEMEIAKIKPLATVACKVEPSTKKVLLAGVVNADGQIDITGVLEDVSDGFEAQFIGNLAKQYLKRKDEQDRANREAEKLKEQSVTQYEAAKFASNFGELVAA